MISKLWLIEPKYYKEGHVLNLPKIKVKFIPFKRVVKIKYINSGKVNRIYMSQVSVQKNQIFFGVKKYVILQIVSQQKFGKDDRTFLSL